MSTRRYTYDHHPTVCQREQTISANLAFEDRQRRNKELRRIEATKRQLGSVAEAFKHAVRL